MDFKCSFFCGYHWETFTKVEPHLVAKNTFGARACTVLFFRSVFKHVF